MPFGFTGGGGFSQLEAIEAANAIDIRKFLPFAGAGGNATACQLAMNVAFGSDGAGFVRIPPGRWTFTAGVQYNVTGNRTEHFGIICEGVIVSTINGASTDVVDILCSSGAQVRHLRIKGLCIKGGGSERHGLAIRCVNGGDGAIYTLSVNEVSIESCGGSGMYVLGDVFEANFLECYCRGNAGRGALLENGAGTGSPVVSSIRIVLGNFSMNTGAGIEIITPVNDVWVLGNDFIANGSYGLMSVNGSGTVSFNHFENNHASAGSAAAGQGAAVINNFFNAYGNTIKCSGAACKQTAGFRTTGGGTIIISGGNMEISGGAPAAELVYFSSAGGAAGWSCFVDGVKLTGGATYSTTHATGGGNFVVDGQPWPINLTGNRTLTNTESGALFTNAGASGAITLTLPASPFLGVTYTFMVRATQNIVADANTSQVIQTDAGSSTSGGTATNGAQGSILTIEYVATNLWMAKQRLGTWTLA